MNPHEPESIGELDGAIEAAWQPLGMAPLNDVTDPFSIEVPPLPDDIEDLKAMVLSLNAVVEAQHRQLQHAALRATESSLGLENVSDADLSDSPFILTFTPDACARELTRLTEWVDKFLLPTYGREISANRPWCQHWPEHPEAVARLHALWLAYGQHADSSAGPSGMAVWHRDILDHTMPQLRAPDGPFAACSTREGQGGHRLLAPPGPTRPQLSDSL